MPDIHEILPRKSLVESTNAPMFDGQYHMCFVTADIEAAQERMAARFGIAKYRIKRDPEAIWSAHAFAGDMMIEIVQPGPKAPSVFLEDRPGGGAVRLHHLGYMVRDAERFAEIEAIVEREGWNTPLRTTAMDGHLRVIFVDARAELGYHQEYVFLTGPALQLYDDVPVN